MEILTLIAREHRVVAPYFPALTSNRSSSRIGSHHDWASLAADLCDLLGIGSAHIVGQSTGGGIAACVASQRADLTRSLTLIDASGTPQFKARSLVAAAVLDYGLLQFDPRSILHAQTQARLAVSFLTNLTRAREQLVRAALIPLYEDLHHVHQRIRAPTQVVWGSMDTLFPLRTAVHLHRTIRGSALHVVDGGVHGWELQRPELAADLVLRFVALNDTGTDEPALRPGRLLCIPATLP